MALEDTVIGTETFAPPICLGRTMRHSVTGFMGVVVDQTEPISQSMDETMLGLKSERGDSRYVPRGECDWVN